MKISLASIGAVSAILPLAANALAGHFRAILYTDRGCSGGGVDQLIQWDAPCNSGAYVAQLATFQAVRVMSWQFVSSVGMCYQGFNCGKFSTANWSAYLLDVT